MKHLLLSLILITSANAWSETVDCKGYDFSTQATITGTCTFTIGLMRSVGKFSGKDLETGELIVGRCEPGEKLDAWNYETGELIIGRCDDF